SRLIRGKIVHPEERVAAGAAVGENGLEMRAVEQARASRQTLPPWHSPAGLPTRVGGQTLAALGTSGVDDRATRPSGHPRTETVTAKTLDSAGLKCPFHDRIRKLLVMAIEWQASNAQAAV